MLEKEAILSEARPETRLNKSMRDALRWVLVAAVGVWVGSAGNFSSCQIG
jgi:hypothetical protein